MANIKICNAELRLAKEISDSWKGSRSNHIVVAPPMSRPRVLFNCLEDKPFLESQLGNISRNIFVVKLDTGDFKSESSFIEAALDGWNISKNNELKGLEPVEKLETGIRLLVNRGHKPVLMIQRFHEALTKLGEDIGTALRNLEHDLGLMTVVELPVSLSVLRERWDLLDKSKAPFLASDWGQGHSSKLLKGYSKDEIKSLATSQEVNNKEIVDFIFDATSGLPELVHLVLEDCKSENLHAVKAKVKNRSTTCCERIVAWLDKPGDNLYKKLFSTSSSNSFSHSENSVFSLQDHDWRELFSKEGRTQRPLMLSWACVTSLIDSEDTYLNNYIKSLFRNQHYSEFLDFYSQTQSTLTVHQERWNGLILLAKFGNYSDPFNPNWSQLEILIREVENYIKTSNRDRPIIDLSSILKWRELISFMLRYTSEKTVHPKKRLEEFVCQNLANHSDQTSFLQILRLRYDHAVHLNDYLSVKSIIEQPESLLQVYGYIRHNLKFWACTKLDDAIADRVAVSFKKPFNLPKEGNPLGFVELMYLIYQLSSDKGEEDIFLPDLLRIDAIDNLYNLRKDQVHGTNFIEPHDAIAYQQWCKEWIEKLEYQINKPVDKLVSAKDLINSVFP